MTGKLGNCINFANAILKKEKLNANQEWYKNMGSYDILTDISEHVTLVQLMDSLVNVNHPIIVVGYWIFDSNYERELVLNRESLDMVCAPSVSEEEVATFETAFCAVIYIFSTTNLNKK